MSGTDGQEPVGGAARALDALSGAGLTGSWAGKTRVATSEVWRSAQGCTRKLRPSGSGDVLPKVSPAYAARLPTPIRGPAGRVNLTATRGMWGREDPSCWAAILARHGEVLRARAGPQGRLEALNRW